MDVASIPFDLAEAGAILADMVAAYLDAAPPPVAEEKRDDHDDFEDQPKSSDTPSLHLHPSVDAGATTRVLVMAHSSRRRCQSWFERARRDASKEKIAPT